MVARAAREDKGEHWGRCLCARVLPTSHGNPLNPNPTDPNHPHRPPHASPPSRSPGLVRSRHKVSPAEYALLLLTFLAIMQARERERERAPRDRGRGEVVSTGPG